MASPARLRARALEQMTSAIKNVLNPADEHAASDDKIPAQGKYPQVDFRRRDAIDKLWDARMVMSALDIPLAREKGYKSKEYLGALRQIKARLGEDSDSALISAKKALDETKDAQVAARLRAAQRSISHVQYDVRLMESRFWRTVASGWFVFAAVILAIAAGLMYYVLYGATSLGLEVAQKPGLATLPANTSSNVKHLAQLMESSTEATDKATKLLKALKDLFSEVPLVIAAGAAVLKGVARIFVK